METPSPATDLRETVPARFAAQARRDPTRVAICTPHGSQRYGALAQAAEALGQALCARLGDDLRPIALLLGNGPQQARAMLGVWGAGRACVPLAPDQPPARLAALLEDAGAALLVHDAAHRERARALYGERCLALEEVPPAEDDPLPGPEPDSPAIILYTSGTTGRPKGVVHTQRTLLANAEAWIARADIRPEDRLCVLHAYTIGASLPWTVAALVRGACVLPCDVRELGFAGLAAWLTRERVTILLCFTTLFRHFVDALPDGATFPALRLLRAGGDPVFPADVVRFRRVFPATARLVNTFGTTETLALCSCFIGPDTPLAGDHVPVGRPGEGVRVRVLGPDDAELPDGEAGELVVEGRAFASGYWRRPELSARAFTPLADGWRRYRTGDGGKRLADGRFVHLGRVDDQVKLRGHRVEPAEVEAALLAHPEVREAAAAGRTLPGSGETRLAAWVVGEVDLAALRGFLTERLPGWMVPAELARVPALPLLPGGKLDRRALLARRAGEAAPRFPAQATPAGGPEAPRGTPAQPPELPRGEPASPPEAPGASLEQELCAFFAELLEVPRYGPDDDFFAAGGDSLSALRICAALPGRFGVRLPLEVLARERTVARLLPRLRAAGAEADAAPWVPDPTARSAPFPLTDVQQAYLVGRGGAFALGNVATHAYREYDLEGVELPRLERALQRLIARHGMLRAVFLEDGTQRVLAELPPYRIAVRDLSGLPAAEVEAALGRVREEMSHQVLPADRAPLFEVRASRLDADRVRLHLSIDALIMDAWSRGAVFFAEWRRLYEEPEAALPPLALSFRDCVLATVQARKGPAHERAWAYWQDRLASLPPAPELPLARAPESVARPRFRCRRLGLEPEAWRRFRASSSAAGLTPSGALLAAYAAALAAWSRGPRFTLNLTLFQRPARHPEVDRVLGDFTSLVLVAARAPGRDPFGAWAKELQEQLWRDLEHSLVSAVRVLRALSAARGRRVAMPVVFTSGLLRGMPREPWPGEPGFAVMQTPQVVMDLIVQAERGALVAHLNTVDALFPPGLPDAFAGALGRLLEVLAADAEAWEAPLPRLLPAAQRARRPAPPPAPAPELLYAPLLARAAERPEAVAVIGARTLTYGELLGRASALAAALRDAGAGPGARAAVVMQKGWEEVVAVLGIALSGAAFVPLDASTPPARLERMLRAAGVALAVTQPCQRAAVAWPAEVTPLVVAEEWTPRVFTPPPQAVDSLAYVIFTSGSTGSPKGVMLAHAAASRTVQAVNQRLAVGPGDALLGLSALSFDLAVYDIFGPLAAGGRLVLPEAAATRDPAAWSGLLEEHEISLWNSVPALMEVLVDFLEDRGRNFPDSLRAVLLSGDWIPVTLPARIRRRSAAALLSLGGATEAAIWSVWHPIGEVPPQARSILYGRALPGQSAAVLDDCLQPRPDFVPGELYVGGEGLAVGYLDDPEQTAARFVIDASGARLYRTGDWARTLPDGNLELLGREDGQVKIQGFRVELGELEATLCRHPGVVAAAAVATGEPGGRRGLAAFFVARDVTLSEAGLAAWLADELPRYLRPASLMRLDGLPLTANGKVDRGALRARAQAGESAAPRAPAGSRARRVADWAGELLDQEIGPDDHLLRRGGTSIELIRLANRIEHELGVRPELGAMFEEPTPRAIAALLGPVPDAAPAPALATPAEREAFRAGEPGLRRDLAGRPAIALVGPEEEPADARRSRRRFGLEPLGLEVLGRWLAGLARRETPAGPRYRYASAGGLYAVQVYLYAKAGRIAGVAEGAYLYERAAARLVPLAPGERLADRAWGPANAPIAEEAGFAVFLVADLAAMTPLYPTAARRFATLEAGAMAHLLEVASPPLGIALCPVASPARSALAGLLELGPDHEPLHALLGGPREPEPEPDGEPLERLLQRVSALSPEQARALLEARGEADG